MIKFQLVVILLLANQVVFSQKKNLFEDIQFTDSMRLVVMHPHYDQQNTFDSYDLIISDKTVFDSVAPLFTYAEIVTNFYDRSEPTIRLIEDKKVIRTWSINPKKASIRIEGESYRFNTDMIQRIASKYPLSYTSEKKEFGTEEEFRSYEANLQLEDSFLFLYSPNFQYKGSFELRFKKSKKFHNPDAISKYLRQKFDALNSSDPFRIFYVANEYNLKNNDQYTMTVESSKLLYDMFNDKNCKKSEWKDAIYSAVIFKIEDN